MGCISGYYLNATTRLCEQVRQLACAAQSCVACYANGRMHADAGVREELGAVLGEYHPFPGMQVQLRFHCNLLGLS